MANLVNCNEVKFTKVSGWTTGPLKPTVLMDTSGTASMVGASIADSIESTLSGLNQDEILMIICSVGETIT